MVVEHGCGNFVRPSFALVERAELFGHVDGRDTRIRLSASGNEPCVSKQVGAEDDLPRVGWIPLVEAQPSWS